MYATIYFTVLAASVFFATCEDTCGPPLEVNQAHIYISSDSDYVLGSSVFYKCDDGFESGGIKIMSKCVKDSTTNELVWSEPEITCQPISCGHPGTVSNARRSGSRFTFLNSVKYICNEGYRISGSSRLYCDVDGLWKGRLPSCNVISCRRPEDLENGEVSYPTLEYNSELTYACKKGFQLSSSESRICGADGKWTGTKPFCKEIQCKLPDKPESGSIEVVGSGTQVGGIVIYKCDPGRKLVGSSRSKCLTTGEWTFPAPKCIQTCKIPTVPYGELGKYEEEYRRYRRRPVYKKVAEGTTLDETEEVILKCDDGYVAEAQARNEITITCLEGNLSPEPVCRTEIQCELPDKPDFGSREVVGNETLVGSIVIYKCDPGRKLVGSSSSKCLTTGEWTFPAPKCIKTCKIPTVPYGELGKYEEEYRRYRRRPVYKNVAEGTTLEETKEVILRCDDGYVPPRAQVQREITITCLEGELSPEPVCRASRCYIKNLPAKEGVNLTHDRPVYSNQEAGIICKKGYTLRYPKPKVHCERGEWKTENALSPCQEAGDRKTTTAASPTVPSSSQVFQLHNSMEKNLETEHDTRITGWKHDSTNISNEDTADESSVFLGDRTAKDGAESIDTDADVIPACSCEYIIENDNLVAHDGKKTLKFGDKIYSNSTVTFYCKHVGYLRLIGPPSLKCQSDCNWHSSLFPSCASPKDEDPIIKVVATPREKLNVGPEGTLMVISGTGLILGCRMKTRNRRILKWTTSASDGAKQLGYILKSGKNHVFYTLPAASLVDSGKYTCFSDYGKSHSIDIEVKVPTCPVDSLFDVIPVGVVPHIDQTISETAPYGYVLNLGCEPDWLVFEGDDTATCSTDGKWKVGVNVTCAQGCAGLKKKDGSELLISPDKRFYDMGETITFLCPEGKELTEDVERILCLGNGWMPSTVPDCH